MIFIDRSIPRAVARALQQVRNDVLWLDDVFPSDTADEDWLAHCGREGWLVITRDKRIRTRPAERAAMRRNSVGVFVITTAASLDRWQLLELLVPHLREMERSFEVTPRPFVFTLSSAGLSQRDLG